VKLYRNTGRTFQTTAVVTVRHVRNSKRITT